MTEQKNDDVVTLNCSVSTYDRCTRSIQVKWLLWSRDVDKENKDVGTSQSACSASVHLKASHYIYKENLLKCEVTVGDKVQLFPFIPEKPGENMMICLKSN